RGTFASPEKIPAHFVRKSPTETKESRLERDYERKDFGIFVEHCWAETVTDSVTFADSQRAARELAELHLGLWVDALTLAYGDEHDFTRLRVWLTTDGVAWVVDLAGAYLQVATLKLPSERMGIELADRMADVSKQY